MRDYDKEIELRKKLGARKFQKVVFKVEEIKFAVMRALFPNAQTKYEKWLDRRRDNALSNATSEEERKRIIRSYRHQKLKMRKEFNREKNLNYHLDMNTTEETLSYLRSNKRIHENGIKTDAAFIIGSLALMPFVPTLATPALVGALAGMFVNFQCVNLQEYNICRIEKRAPMMKKREERKLQQQIANYSQAAEAINRSMEKTNDIPSMTDIINGIKTKEEAMQLKRLIQEQLGSKNRSNQATAEVAVQK